jgi:hypothetical protein
MQSRREQVLDARSNGRFEGAIRARPACAADIFPAVESPGGDGIDPATGTFAANCVSG